MRGSRLLIAIAGCGLAVFSSGTPRGGLAGGVTIALHPNIAYPVGATASAAPPTTSQCEATLHIACYQPFQLQRAYDLSPLYEDGFNGRGRTIVIVDSFGSPTIAHDLARFDHDFGLPAPASFTVIQPVGAVPAYKPTPTRIGWAGETSLDVEWSHAIAPGASILLVETPVSETEGTVGFPQIVDAENYVINHDLGDVISQSFGATEETFPTAQSLLELRSAYVNAMRHQVTVLASSGDSGATDFTVNGSLYLHRVTSWPDSDPLVTAVGGTQLHLDSKGNRTAPDNVWNDTYNVATNQFVFGNAGPNPLASGGGRSIIFERPDFQDGYASVVGQHRGVPDISMSSACNGGVDVYTSFKGVPAGYLPSCGTSEASPLFAGIVAIAAQYAHEDLGRINSALYALSETDAPGIVPITSGNNTVSFTQGGSLHTVTGFTAAPGYSLATGVGTIDAAKLVPELAARR